MAVIERCYLGPCLFCWGSIPVERRRLRGRRHLYCSDDHHERDQGYERAIAEALARAQGRRS